MKLLFTISRKSIISNLLKSNTNQLVFEQQIILGKKQEIKIPGNFKKQGRSKGVASLIFRRRKTHNIPKKRVWNDSSTKESWRNLQKKTIYLNINVGKSFLKMCLKIEIRFTHHSLSMKLICLYIRTFWAFDCLFLAKMYKYLPCRNQEKINTNIYTCMRFCG